MAKAKGTRKRLDVDAAAVQSRILDAAFAAFMANGYAASSTLEIATRARVSKRELYALVGNKEQMLIACISNRSRRFQMPTDLPVPQDRKELERLLAGFGAQLLREIGDPAVVGMFRLAIAEASHAPEVARALSSIGGEAVDAALRKIMAQACRSGLLQGDPDELGEQFWGLLWGSLHVSLLLGIAKPPDPRQLGMRAASAAAAFLQVHKRP